MTTSHILPSTGAPPPQFNRPSIPDELKPKITRAEKSEAVDAEPAPRPEVKAEKPPQYKPVEPAPAPKVAVSENAAVVVQVEESSSAPEPQPAETTQTVHFAGDGHDHASEAPRADEKIEEAPLPPPKPKDIKLSGELSDEEKAYVAELKERDREVRAHEQAHAAAGTGYAGTPQYEYVRGPDGIQYAVSGSVSIDTGTVPDNPEATIAKMETVLRAALAPASPSAQDKAVAAKASEALRQAEADLREKKAEEEEEAQLKAAEEGAGREAAEFRAASGVSPQPVQSISIDLIA